MNVGLRLELKNAAGGWPAGAQLGVHGHCVQGCATRLMSRGIALGLRSDCDDPSATRAHSASSLCGAAGNAIVVSGHREGSSLHHHARNEGRQLWGRVGVQEALVATALDSSHQDRQCSPGPGPLELAVEQANGMGRLGRLSHGSRSSKTSRLWLAEAA